MPRETIDLSELKEKPKEKMSRRFKIYKYGFIILLILIVLAGIYFFGFPYIANYYYNQGYTAGGITVINQIQTSAKIPVVYNNTISWIELTKICGAG